MPERLPKAKIKAGATEADIGQLRRRESQFGRHKETKPRNLEAETVELEQESEPGDGESGEERQWGRTVATGLSIEPTLTEHPQLPGAALSTFLA